jgi:hypothetical protein
MRKAERHRVSRELVSRKCTEGKEKEKGAGRYKDYTVQERQSPQHPLPPGPAPVPTLPHSLSPEVTQWMMGQNRAGAVTSTQDGSGLKGTWPSVLGCFVEYKYIKEPYEQDKESPGMVSHLPQHLWQHKRKVTLKASHHPNGDSGREAKLECLLTSAWELNCLKFQLCLPIVRAWGKVCFSKSWFPHLK